VRCCELLCVELTHARVLRHRSKPVKFLVSESTTYKALRDVVMAKFKCEDDETIDIAITNLIDNGNAHVDVWTRLCGAGACKCEGAIGRVPDSCSLVNRARARASLICDSLRD
jgi:hypothetical protein